MNRTLNVIDEVLKQENELKVKYLTYAKADKTYEQFLDRYNCHFLGQIDPILRVGDRPETVPYNPHKKRMPKLKVKKDNPLDSEDEEKQMV